MSENIRRLLGLSLFLLMALLILVPTGAGLAVFQAPTSDASPTAGAAAQPTMVTLPSHHLRSDPSSPTTSSTTGPAPRSTPTGPCAPSSPSAIAWANNVTTTISLFGASQVVPYVNSVSGYARSVQVTIQTPANVPIEQAEITVWAVGWNNQSLNSTLPNAPGVFSMTVDQNVPTKNIATGQLNDFKFFPPGSTVYFNMSLVQNVTDPSNWTSPCWAGAFNAPWNPAPAAPAPQPTWAYRIGNGWPSPVFENDIQITATPNVMNGVQPDPFQSVYFYLNSSKINMNIGGPLGGARLYYFLHNRTCDNKNAQGCPGGASFCSANATFEVSCYGGVPTGVGPFYEAGDVIDFYFEAFISNDVGVYNKIFSRSYSYTVSAGGTWCQPDSGYNFYGWSGSALPPYNVPDPTNHPTWVNNGNYSGRADPVTLNLSGPVTEIAVYNAVGSAPAFASASLVDPSQVVAPHPGILLPAPPAAPVVPNIAGNTLVTFTETGLPAGTVWSVLFGTQNVSSPTASISFSVAAGQNYSYTVTTPISAGKVFVRYVASPFAGWFYVGGSPVSQGINFTAQVYLDIIQSPWNAGNVSTNPTAYGRNSGWYDNNSEVTLTAIGYFGFPYFLILSAGHSVPFPMTYVISSSTNDSVIPAFGGILNLTISSRNTTTAIAYAYVFFNETYNGQALSGVVLMNEENSTVFYTGDGTQINDPSDIGPFPPGVNITLFVLAYDELGCPLRSDTYHFHTETGTPPTVDSRTFFYVVVYDEAKNQYIPNVPVNMSNATWWDICFTNTFGFCYPNATYSSTPLYLSYGWYNVTVQYDGQVQSVSYYLNPTSNKTLTFIFNSAEHHPPIYSEPTQGFSPYPPYAPLPLLLGLILAGALGIPIVLMWLEQRRKAAAEEKRITL
ncbi:MAG: hypothetical protein KGJ23_14200 [Euryarchaeota archaeon]|nr:hypothetical protein [Euryarchaeota archaeon]MDE1837751.1 hypothetical protein [Euryarchaeota archaeon]MDE1881141.1 hypothetical protein [Euryarchaeota archaeon]MDE2045427.1 hypothetical protein [Thermoplasmata archaeon]